MFVLDSHCDTPSQLIRLRNLGIDNERGQVDFPKLKRGKVDATFFALYTSNSFPPDKATAYALDMLAAVYDSLENNKDKAAMALSPAQAYANKRKGLVSVFLGMENGSPIRKSLPLLRLFYRLGVRYITLCHNGDNEICDSASEGTHWNGLSPFGKEVVAEMNRLGMMIDVAHCSDKTFYDCIEYSRAPIVSTHSCCRALAHHRRNFSDDMLEAISQNDGVIQINFYPAFLSDSFAGFLDTSGIGDRTDAIEAEFIKDPGNPDKIAAWNKAQDELLSLDRPSYKEVVDHIDYAVQKAGIDHVGLGSDFDGITITPEGLEDVSRIGVIFDEMRRRHYSEKDISKVAGANFLRVFNKVIAISRK
ncbi:MAG: dipeptidase [Bacteroidales bacterium]|nr:dipeptidase [Bacteroidales bacterium]